MKGDRTECCGHKREFCDIKDHIIFINISSNDHNRERRRYFVPEKDEINHGGTDCTMMRLSPMRVLRCLMRGRSPGTVDAGRFTNKLVRRQGTPAPCLSVARPFPIIRLRT